MLVAQEVATSKAFDAILNLVRRSECDADVASQLRVRIEPAPFGDVEMDRIGGADELFAEILPRSRWQ